jgi:hypothetical protein
LYREGCADEIGSAENNFAGFKSQRRDPNSSIKYCADR